MCILWQWPIGIVGCYDKKQDMLFFFFSVYDAVLERLPLQVTVHVVVMHLLKRREREKGRKK